MLYADERRQTKIVKCGVHKAIMNLIDSADILHNEVCDKLGVWHHFMQADICLMHQLHILC